MKLNGTQAAPDLTDHNMFALINFVSFTPNSSFWTLLL